jgi:hypothetical protein
VKEQRRWKIDEEIEAKNSGVARAEGPVEEACGVVAALPGDRDAEVVSLALTREATGLFKKSIIPLKNFREHHSVQEERSRKNHESLRAS